MFFISLVPQKSVYIYLACFFPKVISLLNPFVNMGHVTIFWYTFISKTVWEVLLLSTFSEQFINSNTSWVQPCLQVYKAHSLFESLLNIFEKHDYFSIILILFQSLPIPSLSHFTS